MLTQTTETAIRIMIHLARQEGEEPIPIREVGIAVGGSATYVAKTIRRLVEGGLLRSFRGAAGGVRLASSSETITLLAIVEAAQGVLEENYCLTVSSDQPVCAFHMAMVETRAAVTASLSRWSLHMLSRPTPENASCRMLFASSSGPPT